MAARKTVLITGSSGRIGTILRRAFADRYTLRGIDRATPGMDGALVASLADLGAIRPAFTGVDAVVHLAADPRHTPDIGWDTLMPDNVVASANVYEAARQGGVRRVVFFSSMHVCGLYESDPPWSRIAAGDYAGLSPQDVPLVTADMPARPDGLYAVSKIFGEALGRYHAEAHGMEVVVVRLGTVGREDRPGSDARSFVSWLSHRDLAHLTERALDAPGVKHEIVFGASDNMWKIYDTLHARRTLSYAPRDNAERFRDGAAAVPPIVIRPLGAADRDAALAVINEAARWYREFLPPGEYHEPEMAADEWDREARRLTWFGAFVGGTLVGVGGLEHVRDVALLRHGYVLPTWQRAGVGARLVERLETEARGVERLVVGTYRGNYKARRALEKAGYRQSADPEAVLRTYYSIPEARLRSSLTYEKTRPPQ